MTQEMYALCHGRSVKSVAAFLDRFLPYRSVFSDDFPIPELSENPELILNTESEILTFLEQHPNEPYGLYWNDLNVTSSNQAMAFYTSDGNIILGLAEETASPAERLKELASFVRADVAMLGSEQRPPTTTDEFIALCRSQGINLP